MPDGEYGMAPDHPGPGIAHNLCNACAHFGLIAMHGALVADGLVHAKRTVFDASFSVCKQLGTIGAKPSCHIMVGAAVNMDHRGNSPSFEVHVPIFIGHIRPFQD